MAYLGIDIGTTTIGFLILDGESVLEKRVVPNETWIPGKSYEKLQDADRIVQIVLDVCGELEKRYAISGIGISTQMHGIVYLSEEGKAVSPLIIWQDGRGDEIYRDGKSYAKTLSEISGYSLSTGYGSTTLYYDTVHGTFPKGARQIATIGDYAAMRLCGLKRPVMHWSNAASIGLFDIKHASFDIPKILDAGMDPDLYPEVTAKEIIVGTYHGASVTVAIGDNQASFLGSVGEGSSALINIGTGAQISVQMPHYEEVAGLECRPYVDGGYLLVGSSLCGGRAYAALAQFYKAVCGMCGISSPDDLMRRMDREAEKAADKGLTADTRLSGTREDPSATGSVTGIRVDNFSPGAMSYAFLRGICQELYDFYKKIPEQHRQGTILTGSGNGIRCSRIQQRIIREMFGMELRIPKNTEEAAYGAAVCAGSR